MLVSRERATPLAHTHGYIYLLVGVLPRHICDLSGLLMAQTLREFKLCNPLIPIVCLRFKQVVPPHSLQVV